MNKIFIAKQVITTIVGLGTTKIVHSIIQNNTNCETVIDKVTVFSGATVLGAMVADATRSYTDAKIDVLVTFVQDNIINRPKAEETQENQD